MYESLLLLHIPRSADPGMIRHCFRLWPATFRMLPRLWGWRQAVCVAICAPPPGDAPDPPCKPQTHRSVEMGDMYIVNAPPRAQATAKGRAAALRAAGESLVTRLCSSPGARARISFPGSPAAAFSSSAALGPAPTDRLDRPLAALAARPAPIALSTRKAPARPKAPGRLWLCVGATPRKRKEGPRRGPDGHHAFAPDPVTGAVCWKPSRRAMGKTPQRQKAPASHRAGLVSTSAQISAVGKRSLNTGTGHQARSRAGRPPGPGSVGSTPHRRQPTARPKCDGAPRPG